MSDKLFYNFNSNFKLQIKFRDSNNCINTRTNGTASFNRLSEKTYFGKI